jgi:hypothetical protein
MDIKGVCYDVGRVYGYEVARVNAGRFRTRPVFDPGTTRRELQIIRDDLRCNAVRFQGRDITRLMTAAADALELGLQVWFSPEMFEQSRERTLAYVVRAATAAESLRQRFEGRLVFCVGTESSLFTRGIVPGRSVDQRVANIRTAGLRSRPYAGPLQAFLADANQRVRQVFRGPLSYASTPFEVVDWSLFDVIGVDHYRNSKVDDHRYAETIKRYLGQGKPVVNSEFGHSAYRGNRPGHMEFGEVDTVSLALHRIPLAGRLVRARLKQGSHLRDEGHQARELTKTLGILDAEGADGAVVWTIADPHLTYSPDPRHDLDMTATSLVKTYPRGHGTTYPDLPWEPKQAFGAVASFYAAH